MNKYYIGIIDEDQNEILDIKRTIFANKPECVKEDYIQFVDYHLPSVAETLLSEMTKTVAKDISNGKIHLLIVDYKIIVESTCIEGTEIFKGISALVPKFPTIILTNVPEDCYKPFIDADKVYSKRSFFKIENSYSKEKTLNIFRNIDNYKNQCAELMANLSEQRINLEREGYSQPVYEYVISLENKLGDYLPQEHTVVEQSMDLSDLRDAVELLKEAKGLLGD